MNTLEDVLDEFQAQVVDGYALPVNGWTTLKQGAEAAITELVEGALPEIKTTPLGRPTAYNDGFNSAIGNIRSNLQQAGLLKSQAQGNDLPTEDLKPSTGSSKAQSGPKATKGTV